MCGTIDILKQRILNECEDACIIDGVNLEVCFFDAVCEWHMGCYNRNKEEDKSKKGIADFESIYFENGLDEDRVLNIDRVQAIYKDLAIIKNNREYFSDIVDLLIEDRKQVERIILERISEIRRRQGLKRGNEMGSVKTALKWEYERLEDGVMQLPNKKFWALHSLFLTDRKFCSIFTKTYNRSNKEYAELIIKYGALLYEAEFDNIIIYERLTGLNLSIMTSNYLFIIDESLKKLNEYFGRTDDDKIIINILETIKGLFKDVLLLIIEAPVGSRINLMHNFGLSVLWEMCQKINEKFSGYKLWDKTLEDDYFEEIMIWTKKYVKDLEKKNIADMCSKISYVIYEDIKPDLENNQERKDEVYELCMLQELLPSVNILDKELEQVLDGYISTIQNEGTVLPDTSFLKIWHKVSKMINADYHQYLSENDEARLYELENEVYNEKRETYIRRIMEKLVLDCFITDGDSEKIFRVLDEGLSTEIISFTMKNININSKILLYQKNE